MRRTTTTGPVAMYLSELSEGSRRTMRFALSTAAAFFGGRGGDPDTFPWHKVRVDRISALRADLASRLAPNTANQILSAVKGVLANCDGSTLPPVLNANDYFCFNVRFLTGASYANCDLSTTPPILNVLDFVCFVNRFAPGCTK